jgi:hypothetical protein
MGVEDISKGAEGTPGRADAKGPQEQIAGRRGASEKRAVPDILGDSRRSAKRVDEPVDRSPRQAGLIRDRAAEI